MVMVTTHNTRRVKGEDACEPPMLEHFPPTNHATRQYKPSTRRRDLEEQPQQDYFVTLRVDKQGQPHFDSSASLKHFEKYIMGNAYRRLLEVVPEFSTPQRDYPKPRPDPTRMQFLPSGVSAFMPLEDNAGISYAFPQRRAKRRRSSTMVTGRCAGSDSDRIVNARSDHSKTRKTVEIWAGDSLAMERWYRDAFHAVQQVSCRLVAKLWIKRVHLKKQSTHPYNGGYPRDVARDPERTKPYYWPRDVRHKEPDHITRDERVRVLMNVIANSPLEEINSADERKHFVSAQQLLEALEERRSDIPDDKWEILQDIVKARTYQEKFNRQEIDSETVVTLVDCSADTRRSQGETDDDINDNDRDHLVTAVDGDGDTEQLTEEGPSMTPASSNLPSPRDQLRPNGDSMTLTEAARTSTIFTEPFNSERVKGEDMSNMSDAYPGPEDLALVHHDTSQHVSPIVEMTREDFEHDMYTHGALVSEAHPQHNIVMMQDLREHHNHQQELQHWPVTMPPDNMFAPVYPSHPGFQPHGMTMEDQMNFEEAPYHHSPTPRRQAIINGLVYPGTARYPPGFNIQDQRGLPMRPASGLRQNIMAHELELVPNSHTYYQPL